MKTWHSPVVNYFRRRLPSDSFIRPYAKRLIEDARSILHSRRDWAQREQRPPETLVIETSNICNANCVFCAYQYQKKFRASQGVMSNEVFEKALEDYVALVPDIKARRISFTPLVGEPLVDPHFSGRVGLAKTIGADVTFFTNGILLNRVDVKELLDTRVDRIFLSTAPFDSDTHERLYRTEGKYTELLSGVQKLLATRNRGHYSTSIHLMFRSDVPLRQIINMPDFRRAVLPELREDEVHNIYAQVRGFDNWGGQIRQEDLPHGMTLAQAPRLKHRPCYWTFSLMVMFDGRVRACSARFSGCANVENDGLLIGDVRSESLAQIWHSERLRALHRSFERGTLHEVCRNCTMYRSV